MIARMDVLSEKRIIEVDRVHTAVVKGTVAFADITSFFDRVFTAVPAAIHAAGVVPAGPAFARYNSHPTDTVDIEAGFAVSEPYEGASEVSVGEDGVVAGELPAGRVATATLRGGYDLLSAAWPEMIGWVMSQGEHPGEVSWEVYVTEPTPDADPAAMITELYCTLLERSST